MGPLPDLLAIDGAMAVVVAWFAVGLAGLAAIHNFSLVHDDIEDDDAFRYGKPTVHHRHGTATAINVGDYLIGLRYRLVAAQREHLPGDAIR